ncbi:antitoxin Xre/MbcA/ParS toxin-binding domain-containing protein [Dyella telluris]
MLLQLLGSRDRAARWMCMRQRSLGGRTAYEALAEGDFDLVWDQMLGVPGVD